MFSLDIHHVVLDIGLVLCDTVHVWLSDWNGSRSNKNCCHASLSKVLGGSLGSLEAFSWLKAAMVNCLMQCVEKSEYMTTCTHANWSVQLFRSCAEQSCIVLMLDVF